MTTILAIIVIAIVLFLLFKVFKIVLRIALVAVFLILAYITNPDTQEHIHAVEVKAEKTGASLRHKEVKVNDFKIFSLTKIVADDEEKLVGAGLFTKVWIFRDL
jgi:hypothetical protein